MSTDKNVVSQEQAPVEVVDAAGRTLAVMPASEAHRQSLPHRAAQVLFFDRLGRLLLERRGPAAPSFPGRWDLPARDHIRPGESAQDTARRLADALYPGLAMVPVLAARAAPGPATGHEALWTFHCRLAGDASLTGREVLPVGREELEALAGDFRELLTPEVVNALESGEAFPRNGRLRLSPS